MIPDIVVAGLRHNLLIEIHEAPYDQLNQIALGDLDPFANINLDLILLAIDVQGFSILRMDRDFLNEKTIQLMQ